MKHLLLAVLLISLPVTLHQSFWESFAVKTVATVEAQVPKKPQERKKYATGRKVDPKKLASLRADSLARHHKLLMALPKVTATTWDCRTLGIVPPIVDQGQCGSCWDFSGTSVATSAFMMAMGSSAPGPLSEQYTLDCGQNGGCNGDDNSTVLIWAKSTGLPTTTDYGPYQGAAGSCKSGTKLWQIQDWGFADGGQGSGVTDTQLIKNAMVKYGPIGAAIAADDAFMNNPAGTVFMGSGSTSIDHDIVLCGWDDTKVSGKTCWLLRNSWGTSWCDSGYCWILAGANLVGTEAVWAVAAGGPPPTAPVISSAATASGVVGTPFNYQIVASNSPVSYAATGLPAGLVVSATSGAISGTPAATGVSPVILSATNASGTGTLAMTLTVTATPPPPPPGAPVITSAATANAMVSTAYTFQITATNSPTIFAAFNLPIGLTCAPATGAITGTPTTVGTSAVTILAVNQQGAGVGTLTLTVTNTPVNPVNITLTSDQVQAVLNQAGAIVVTDDVTIKQLTDIITRSKSNPPVVNPQDGNRVDRLEKKIEDLNRGMDAILKALLPPGKTTQAEPPLAPQRRLPVFVPLLISRPSFHERRGWTTMEPCYCLAS